MTAYHDEHENEYDLRAAKATDSLDEMLAGMVTFDGFIAAREAVAVHSDQIQGFFYPGEHAPNMFHGEHVVRDLTKHPGYQTIWSATSDTGDAYSEAHSQMMERIAFERFRLLISALNPDILRGMREALDAANEQIEWLKDVEMPSCAHEFYNLGYQDGQNGNDHAKQPVLRSLSPRDPSNGK